jgi:hypothetical protein
VLLPHKLLCEDEVSVSRIVHIEDCCAFLDTEVLDFVHRIAIGDVVGLVDRANGI